ncbi:VpaChn25_0724 family phage protein [Pseudoroseicyclus sp. H15]
METLIREQARLIVLKALAADPGETLNSDLLREELKPFGIRKDRAWLHLQLDWMAEVGVITLRQVGTVKVATLAHDGARHLEREIAVEGIQRPSRPGG